MLSANSAPASVGAAILEPAGTDNESVRMYLKQAILPAITEALSQMEKEKCAAPTPTIHGAATPLTVRASACTVPNGPWFGSRTTCTRFGNAAALRGRVTVMRSACPDARAGGAGASVSFI